MPSDSPVCVLALLDAADEAATELRPLCQAQLPIEPGEPGTVLACDLPARHLSQEHYDRATGTVWIHPDTEPIERPGF